MTPEQMFDVLDDNFSNIEPALDIDSIDEAMSVIADKISTNDQSMVASVLSFMYRTLRVDDLDLSEHDKASVINLLKYEVNPQVSLGKIVRDVITSQIGKDNNKKLTPEDESLFVGDMNILTKFMSDNKTKLMSHGRFVLLTKFIVKELSKGSSLETTKPLEMVIQESLFGQNYRNDFKRLWPRLAENIKGNFASILQSAWESFLSHIKTNRDINKRITPAQESDPLGRWAFAEERSDVPWEQNTNGEDTLYTELQRHFKNGSTLSVELSDMISSFIERDLYPDYFTPADTRETLYRGMLVKREWLEAAIGSSDTTQPQQGSITKKFVFKPYAGVGTTSWTSDKKTSSSFSRVQVDNKHDRSHEFSVVLTASVKDNTSKFVRVPDDSNEGGLSLRLEHEVLGLGDIHVKKLEWKKH
jgi:hypothetical protein